MKWRFRAWLGPIAGAALAFALYGLVSYAAYQPGPAIVLENLAGQAVGTDAPGQPTIPQVNKQQPQLLPIPVPQPVTRWGRFLDAIGRPMSYITDGLNFLTFAPPNQGAAPGQAAAVVAQSPNPSIQCPLIAAVNQTASATVITNPGSGKVIHVCNVLLVTATAQGVGIAEGTGTTCATGTVYWDGGSGGTVSPGLGGGYAVASDRITYPMQVAGDNVCVLQSSTGNVSGHINYGVFAR